MDKIIIVTSRECENSDTKKDEAAVEANKKEVEMKGTDSRFNKDKEEEPKEENQQFNGFEVFLGGQRENKRDLLKEMEIKLTFLSTTAFIAIGTIFTISNGSKEVSSLLFTLFVLVQYFAASISLQTAGVLVLALAVDDQTRLGTLQFCKISIFFMLAMLFIGLMLALHLFISHHYKWIIFAACLSVMGLFIILYVLMVYKKAYTLSCLRYVKAKVIKCVNHLLVKLSFIYLLVKLRFRRHRA